jgi:hypothetical protein
MSRIWHYFAVLVVSVVLQAGTGQVAGASVIGGAVTTDLWDVSGGVTVTNFSPVENKNATYRSDPRNMLGYDLSGIVGPTDSSSIVGPTDLRFADGFPRGTVHFVEWQTATPITLRSFVLNAYHDGYPRDANYRGFSQFTLLGFNPATNAFDLTLFEIFPSNPYGDTPAPSNGVVETNGVGNLLRLGANVKPFTGDRFRAEFVQYGVATCCDSGPRVMELDGFDTLLTLAGDPASVPEPGVLTILGVGIAGLGLVARRRRKTV